MTSRSVFDPSFEYHEICLWGRGPGPITTGYTRATLASTTLSSVMSPVVQEWKGTKLWRPGGLTRLCQIFREMWGFERFPAMALKETAMTWPS